MNVGKHIIPLFNFIGSISLLILQNVKYLTLPLCQHYELVKLEVKYTNVSSKHVYLEDEVFIPP